MYCSHSNKKCPPSKYKYAYPSCGNCRDNSATYIGPPSKMEDFNSFCSDNQVYHRSPAYSVQYYSSYTPCGGCSSYYHSPCSLYSEQSQCGSDNAHGYHTVQSAYRNFDTYHKNSRLGPCNRMLGCPSNKTSCSASICGKPNCYAYHKNYQYSNAYV